MPNTRTREDFSSNPVVSSLPNYVQENHDLILKNFGLVGIATRQRIGIQTGIKKSAYLNFLEVEPVLQDGSDCGFSASGSVTLTQRTINVATIKVDMDICPKKLLGKYAEYLVRVNASAEELPFEQYIMDGVVREINKKIEKLIWQGDTTKTTDTNLKWFNGFLKQFATESSAMAAYMVGANGLAAGARRYHLREPRPLPRIPPGYGSQKLLPLFRSPGCRSGRVRIPWHGCEGSEDPRPGWHHPSHPRWYLRRQPGLWYRYGER